MVGELEAEIFSRVIDPSNPSLTPQAAQGILSLRYSDADHVRMADLAEKSDSGSLTIEEHRELEVVRRQHGPSGTPLKNTLRVHTRREARLRPPHGIRRPAR
jgi:hypothetical protein